MVYCVIFDLMGAMFLWTFCFTLNILAHDVHSETSSSSASLKIHSELAESPTIPTITPRELETKTDTKTKKISCGSTTITCKKDPYRSFDGTCNNLENPSWGAAKEPFAELVKNSYADGVHQFPETSENKQLPNPRAISLLLFPYKNIIDYKWNLNTMQWGQIIAHDMSLSGRTTLITDNPPTCCDSEGQLTSASEKNPFCAPIIIPEKDVVNKAHGRTCMDFIRTVSTKDINCTSSKSPSFPINEITAYLDLSLTYGNSKKQADSLREGRGGRLKVVERNGGTWPPQAANALQTCSGATSADEPCYVAGDARVNQNPQLTVLQVILLKEHNRIADTLSDINKHWDDEKIYQIARRINIAINLYIHYNEFLPILLGEDNMVKNKLIYPNAKGYVNDYNPNVKAGVLKEFATAAYRYFHTLIRGQIRLYKESRFLYRSIRLSDWMNKPSILEENDGYDGLAIGLSFQHQHKSDQYFDREITQYLFKGNKTFGDDLRAIDIQRARDHGVANYIDVRSYCGLSIPKEFDDLRDYMSRKNVKALKSIYKRVEDIELTVGGSLEKHVSGTLVGPTFLCILLRQFYITRVGDRYFYENGDDKEIAFTLDQLQTIRKGSSMARLFCDNGIHIKKMQAKAFELVSPWNTIVPCDQLPFVNLTLWKDTQENEKCKCEDKVH
ncbi:unnamed protein product [Parnassius apollo]|uniref:(apollo) hypothetical protein n=1 Tax=Parnassius apollo TaxID=110799 RepID=A0A8S3WN57_PARAO|nr:unnamed protein product [Parnassius apollo]